MGAARTTMAAFGLPVDVPEGMRPHDFTSLLDDNLKGTNLTYLTCGVYGGLDDVYVVATDSVTEVATGKAMTLPQGPEQMFWARDLWRMIARLDLRTPMPQMPPAWLVLHDES